ncbi:MAG: hypothetical protein KJO11_00185 [Gemmatimonadetes bacterium]|nr:hypothetical protein [Gemmatimonadota bacterium]MBT8477823.1 hypothetical protein [Gemmatimonadota bacterium]NNF39418.1 hypothetical protein [Gemmatimonadota bacterium]NNK49357.1 hypothetical protein [Gemmatimonadota bacterium]
MNRRIRPVAGLLALLAFTFSFSEAVWASTCLPGMRMAEVVVMSEGAASESIESTPISTHDERDSRGGDNPRPCPFNSPLAAQACAGIASMPAPSTEPSTPAAEMSSAGFTVAAPHELLLEIALFRPPRA